MKKRQKEKKGKYLLGLLVGVVTLGVGYAALTNIPLSIAGSATANGSITDADFKVRFVQSSDLESEIDEVRSAAANPATGTVITGETVETTQSVTGDRNATFSVEGMVQGDEVKFTYYIVNLSNGLSANITPDVTNSNSNNFSVEIAPNELFNLDQNEVQEVTVTVKCIAQDLEEQQGSFNVSFNAVAIE